MATLGNIRVKHSMLFTTHVQIKTYLECIDRNYLGEMDPAEMRLIEELKKVVAKIEHTLDNYAFQEAEILG